MSCSLYKPGDKVMISPSVKANDRYDGTLFAPDMASYKNRILTIDKVKLSYYLINEDNHRWCWIDEFLEPVNKGIFDECNALLLANGEIRLVHEDRLYLPNSTSIGVENYNGRKHSFDNNFDIVEVHEKATGNYLFELSGKLIEEEQ